MNAAQGPTESPNLDRYTEALRLNTAALVNDVNATAEALQQTVELQQQAQNGLMDRITLLEAQLADVQREAIRSAADLHASRVATAALTRQLTSQQEEAAKLRSQLQAEKKEKAEMRILFETLINNWNRSEYIMSLAVCVGGLAHIPECGEFFELQRTTLPKNFRESNEFLKNHPLAQPSSP